VLEIAQAAGEVHYALVSWAPIDHDCGQRASIDFEEQALKAALLDSDDACHGCCLGLRHVHSPRPLCGEPGGHDAFLECGILAHGFLRLLCANCGHDKLVAFSCKRRGFCP